jgi:hypothetical protein
MLIAQIAATGKLAREMPDLDAMVQSIATLRPSH